MPVSLSIVSASAFRTVQLNNVAQLLRSAGLKLWVEIEGQGWRAGALVVASEVYIRSDLLRATLTVYLLGCRVPLQNLLRPRGRARLRRVV